MPRLAVLCLLGFISGYCAAGSHVPVARIEPAGVAAELPRRADFAVLQLDVSAVLGRVRVFGDGRVAVLEYGADRRWEPYELRLDPRELDRLVGEIVGSAVLDYDPEVVRDKIHSRAGRGLPRSSHPVSATLTIRLSRLERDRAVVDGGFSTSATLRDWRLISGYGDFYADVPELLALADAIERLLELDDDPPLRPLPDAREGPSSPPSWANRGVGSATPRILYFSSHPRGVHFIDWLGGDRRHLPVAEMRLAYDQLPSVSPDRGTVT